MARRRALPALLTVLGLALAGCSAESLLPGGAATTTQTTASVSSDDPMAAAPAKAESFNPFKDPTADTTGGRVVIANPTLDEVMKPGPLPEMALGRPDAPVTIIKYASLTCPYCRQFHATVFPELKRNYIDLGKVRFILREFPIGFQSGAATIALRCASPDKYFDLYGKFMAQQNVWVSQEVRVDPILKVASQAGLTRDQFEACRTDKTLVGNLNAIKERGRTLGVIGTPNFFINGKLYKSTFDLPALKAVIDPLVSGGALASPARS